MTDRETMTIEGLRRLPTYPDLIRAARCLLRLSESDLAAAATLSRCTISRLESGHRIHPECKPMIERALRERGAELVPGRWPGVRLRKPLF